MADGIGRDLDRIFFEGRESHCERNGREQVVDSWRQKAHWKGNEQEICLLQSLKVDADEEMENMEKGNIPAGQRRLIMSMNGKKASRNKC